MQNRFGQDPPDLDTFYEDFKNGQKFETKEREVTWEDIQKFGTLTGDMNKLHMDEEYARKTIFGGPIAHGMFTLSLALGMWYSLDLTRNTVIAFLGVTDVSFKGPVRAGDFIRLVSMVEGKRESKSRPYAGIVTFKDQVIKSSKEIVMESERTLLVKKRGSDI